jgi:hypothetical protein
MKININDFDNHLADEKSKFHYYSFHLNKKILNSYQAIRTFFSRWGQKDPHLVYGSLHSRENALSQALKHFLRNFSILFQPLLKFLKVSIYLYTFPIPFH